MSKYPANSSFRTGLLAELQLLSGPWRAVWDVHCRCAGCRGGDSKARAASAAHICGEFKDKSKMSTMSRMLCWSPDGEHIAIGTQVSRGVGGEVIVVDSKALTIVGIFRPYEQMADKHVNINSVCFNPDPAACVIAAALSKLIIVLKYDVVAEAPMSSRFQVDEDEEDRLILRGHTEKVLNVCYTHNGAPLAESRVHPHAETLVRYGVGMVLRVLRAFAGGNPR